MELEVLLDTPIKVQADGANETDVLYLNAPTPAMRRIRTRMIGTLFGAMAEVGKKFQVSGDDKEIDSDETADRANGSKMDAESIMIMLYTVNCGEYMEKMQDIFDKVIVTKGIAFCHESKVPMTADLWAKVDNQDMVIAEYLANFILPALDTMKARKR